jgi:hypothetical protein
MGTSPYPCQFVGGWLRSAHLAAFSDGGGTNAAEFSYSGGSLVVWAVSQEIIPKPVKLLFGVHLR